MNKKFFVIAILLCSWSNVRAEEQNYFFTGAQRFPQSYQQTSNGFLNPQDLNVFRKPQTEFDAFRGDSFIPTGDLDTSDLPAHLQRNLPQYQLSLVDNPTHQSEFRSPFSSSQNIQTKFPQHVAPSTHRPSYSHLFSKTSHNHDPSQPETFLGEITIQSPADLPLEFQNRNIGGFQPSVHFPIQSSINKPSNKSNASQTNNSFLNGPPVVNQHLDYAEKPNLENNNQISSSSKPSFLNHRTRIFAPEFGSRSQVNNYFVNNDGEVYSTTKKQIFNSLPTATSNVVLKRNRNIPTAADVGTTITTQDTRTIENTFDLDSLLEEPLDKSDPSSNKNNVEVIQAVTLSPDQFYYPNLNSTNGSPSYDNHALDDYDYDTTEIYDEVTSANNVEDATEITEFNTVSDNFINNKTQAIVIDKEEAITNVEDSKYEPSAENNSSNYDVLTMKPSTMVKDDNFKKFVDSAVIDNTADTPADPIPSLYQEKAVVSVVTTKSIINSTIIGTIPAIVNATEKIIQTTQASILANSTTDVKLPEQLSSPKSTIDEEVSTEGWVVVASVQTSRSVSGARYLPFPVVEQHERTKLLNEPIESENEKKVEINEKNERTGFNNDTESSTIHASEKQNTSTESLIDKLDRVQSDLSSSLLTGSFNNDGNNIAVITEGMLDKSDETTMFHSSSEINTTMQSTSVKPFVAGVPPVIIRKFSPHIRPTTTRSKLSSKLHNQSRKIDLEKPQGDQPIKLLVPDIKLKNGTTGRSSGISNQNKIIVQDVNSPKEAELSKKTLENILNKLKFKETSALVPAGYQEKVSTKNTQLSDDVLKNVKTVNVSAFLPQGYELTTENPSPSLVNLSGLLPTNYKTKLDESKIISNTSKSFTKDATHKTDIISNILKKSKQNNASVPLPPSHKSPEEEKSKNKSDIITNLFKNAKTDNLLSLLPPGFKLPNEDKKQNQADITSMLKKSKEDDVSALLPPGYKLPKSTTTKPSLATLTQDDIKLLLPGGYKLPTEKSNVESIFVKSVSDDISKFLPPGYKPQKEVNDTNVNIKIKDFFENAKSDDVSALLPPGYKPRFSSGKSTSSTAAPSSTTEKTTAETTTASSNVKVIFPSRPGGAHRKNQKFSTPKSSADENVPSSTSLSILKGWPSRATTEFTGWPTPSTTPLSIEKLLERARAAVGATTSTTSLPISTTTVTTTTTTTTTPRPTTPGLCVTECDLAGTIKLTGGAKWVPELLDRNTKEWQILANEVQYQLEEVYSKSEVLSKWYKKIRIDGFSEGSVLVDYLVELNNVSSQINTKELKGLFHDALEEALAKNANNREAKSSDLRTPVGGSGNLALGNFMVDPTYTDFVVLPKQILPTVGYAEDNVLLPQWAIAIIVIGLASLLFVIIFGVTVIVNRQKNAKKKQPSMLTEEMLNELNKNHMGGIDNYGADDLYNMEDVWNDKSYEAKLPKKRSAGSLHDSSMPNIYDSWRSEWNGYYYNTYYGNHPGSSHSGYGRRRSDYDTNF
ncbi:hypothetical protein FQA39_LY14976 [Lamprigera yunnana]|nr:hypothetical protein FQA39_LY14976 [Lamprigera yunnana]